MTFIVNFILSLIYKKFFFVSHVFNFGLFSNDLNFFYFEIFFIFSIIILLVFLVIVPNKRTFNGYYLSVSNILMNILPFIVLILLLLLNNNITGGYYLFNGFYYNDIGISFFKGLILAFFILFIFALKSYLVNFKNYDFEFILVVFISLFSSILVLNSNDLISLFFIIELQSLTFYILVSSKQVSSFSTESGLKYFILGCFSSGIILFGISLIYGFTGLLSYNDLAIFLSSGYFIFFDSFVFSFIFTGFIAGVILLSVGLLFKFGAVPFHMWMPDVYEGAPMVVTFYLSTLPKISLIFIFFKLYYFVFFEIFAVYQILFVITAVLSIFLGSIAAIYQIKIKRLLTYSMITNSGYLILGLSLGDVSGIYVTLFYLLSYIFIMVGLFFCFITLRDRSNEFLIKKLTSLVNLLEINAPIAFSIFILLFSIAGVPPLLGFYGKFFLFAFTLKLQMYWLTILFVIFSVISVFYYIRIVKIMYFNRDRSWIFFHEVSFGSAFVISLITIVNCVFFLNPNLLFRVIHNFSFYLFI